MAARKEKLSTASLKNVVGGQDFNEETMFVTEEVSSIVREVLDLIIMGQEFSNENVKIWTPQVLSSIIQRLTALQKPFKYIANCSIMQKCGAGFDTASSCFWDAYADGCCTIRWENKFVIVVVTVFGLTL